MFPLPRDGEATIETLAEPKWGSGGPFRPAASRIIGWGIG